jgi:hypothetical protein
VRKSLRIPAVDALKEDAALIFCPSLGMSRKRLPFTTECSTGAVSSRYAN